MRFGPSLLVVASTRASIDLMATLHVRDVPEETYEALRRLAAERGSSMNTEAIRLLGRALRTDRAAVQALLEQIESRRPVPRRKVPAPAALIRRDRDGR
jgi:plasmid stability protein